MNSLGDGVGIGPVTHQIADLGAQLARDPASHAWRRASSITCGMRRSSICAAFVRWRWRRYGLSRPTTQWSCSWRRRGRALWPWDGSSCARAAAGGNSRVSRLQDLPKGAHCSSCNIDYERNFSRNVELTFHPEPWIRPLPDGEMCMLGQGSQRHIKFQGEVAARSSPTSATRAVATIGPMPGISSSRRLSSHERCQAWMCFSMAPISAAMASY